MVTIILFLAVRVASVMYIILVIKQDTVTIQHTVVRPTYTCGRINTFYMCRYQRLAKTHINWRCVCT